MGSRKGTSESPRHDPYRGRFHYRGHLLALAQAHFFLGLPRDDGGQAEAAIERHARERPFGLIQAQLADRIGLLLYQLDAAVEGATIL